MKRLLLSTWLYLCFAGLLLAQKTNKQQTIYLTKDASRYPIHLEEGQQKIELCQLKVGQTYQLIVTIPKAFNCTVEFDADKPFDRHERLPLITIKPKESCYNFNISTSCQALPSGTILSVKCIDCLKEEPEKSFASIQVSSNSDPQYLIQDVFIGGGCFDVVGATRRGDQDQTGTFSMGGSSIGIENGIILSSGNIHSSAGPNNAPNTSLDYGNIFNDPDLVAISNGNNIYDVASIEFFFTPTVSTISFQYAFASEEYCEFADSQFNDVFGFFISGPGINGTYSNNAENIAQLPGGAGPVSIQNVNHVDNSQYYVDNVPLGVSAVCNSAPGAVEDDIEYDGLTSVLTAVANVIPCQTYRIKLIVADASDGNYDSAVFLKANSFNAGDAAAVATSISGPGPAQNAPYEGCSDAFFTFERAGNDLSQPYFVPFTISPLSTATAGVDYGVLPNAVVIPAGQSSITLFVDVFGDFILEGTETIILELANPCSCNADNSTIEITEPPPLNVVMDDIIACDGAEVVLSPNVSGGIPGYTYQWSNGSTNPSLVLEPTGLQNFALTVFDQCGQSAFTTFSVFGSQPTATISGTDAICQGNFNASLQIEFTGIGPYDITYSIDGFYETISGVYGSPFNLPVSVPGTYELVAVSAFGCEGMASGTGEVSIEEVLVEVDTTNVSCSGLDDGAINIEVAGGTSPYSYNWNQDLPDQEDLDSLGVGTYTITVTDANGCMNTASASIEEPEALVLNVDEIANLDCSNPDNGSIEVGLSGGNAPYVLEWNTGDTTALIDGLEAGTYALTVTDDNNCQISTSAIIEDNIAYPSAVAEVTDILDCGTNTVNINANTSSTGAEFSYEWIRPDGTGVSGTNSLSLTADSPGIYEFIVTNTDNSCTSSTSVEVMQDLSPPLADAGISDTITCNDLTLLLDGSGSSQGANFTYQWSSPNGMINTGAQSLTPQIDQAGQYILEVLDNQNNCVTLDTVSIAEDLATPNIIVNTAGIINCYSPSIEISSEGSDYGDTFTYIWTSADGNINSNPNAEDITVDAVGTYQLSITNLENGCSNTESTAITENFMPPTADAGPDQELDCITSSTLLDGGNSSNNGNFQYNWTTETGNFIGDSSNIAVTVDASGIYSLNIIDLENGCSDSSSVVVSENSDAPTINVQVDGILTCSVLEVILDGMGSASESNFELEWSSLENNQILNADQLQATITEPGTYTLSITDQNTGCISSSSITVSQDIIHPQVDAGIGFTLTCAEPAFTLDGSNSDQGDPFLLEWTGPDAAIEASPNTVLQNIQTAGTYHLNILNTENGCSSQDSIEVIADQAYPIALAGPDLRLTCALPELAILADASSSGSNFSINWNTLEGSTQIPDGALTHFVQNAGIFELVIANTGNGCITQDTVTVLEDLGIPNAIINPTSILNCVDTFLVLDASLSSQGSNFQYQWSTSDGNILQGQDGLSPMINTPGNYELEILNSDNDCLNSTSISVNQDITPPVADAGTDFTLTCTQPEISLQGQNSSQGLIYEYEWSSPDASITIDNEDLTPVINEGGHYHLLVRNIINGCTSSDEVVIQVDQELPIAIAGPDLTLNCMMPSVQLEATSSSNGQDYDISWNTLNGAIQPESGNLNPSIDDSGLFELEITDITNGCISRDTVEVVENFQSPVADAGPVQTLTCVDTVLVINASLSSQGAEYDYAWTTTDGNILDNPNALIPQVDAPGNYQLIITHQESFCQDTAEVEILQNIELPMADAGNPFTLTCNDPVQTLDGSNSSQGSLFSYFWESNEGQNIDGIEALDPGISEAGTYTLSVLNTQNGCQSFDAITIDVNQVHPQVLAGPDVELNCALTSFQVQANASDTGNDFSIQWNTLEGVFQVPDGELTPTVDQSGVFELVISNTQNGCSTSDTLAFTENFAMPVADAGDTNILNCRDTSLILDGSNSSQGAIYTYSWNSDDGHFLSPTTVHSPGIDAPGTYTLIVSHTESFCEDTASVLINQDINLPIAGISNPDTLTCEIASVSLDGSTSSTGELYTYSWQSEDGNVVGNSNEITAVADSPGQYQLEVTNNENGCKTTTLIDVEEDRVFPVANAGPDGRLTCAIQSVNLDGSPSSNGIHIAYQWTPLEGQNIEAADEVVASVNTPGSYALTVLNLNNQCASFDTVSISIDTIAPIASAGLNDTLTCTRTQLTLDGADSSTGDDFVYQWNSPSDLPIANASSLYPQIEEAGTYQLLVSNTDNGCLSNDVVNIAIDTLYPSLLIAAPEILTCAIPSIPLTASANANHPMSFLWSTSEGLILEGQESLFPVIADAGFYELTATNQGNGCISTAIVEVGIDTLSPIANAGVAPGLNCTTSSIQLNGEASSQGNYSYQWTGPANSILNGAAGLFPMVSSPGMYTLLVQNMENGCTQLDQVEVVLNDVLPVGGIVPPEELNCEIASVTLNGYSDESTTPYDYHWEDEDGHILGLDSPLSIDVNQPGSYGFFITNLENNCLDSVFVTVSQDIEIPIADAGEMAILTCIETTAILEGDQSSTGNYFNYEWSTSNGQILSGSNSLSPIVNQEGIYSLFVENQNNGCTNEDQVTVIEEVPEAATIIKADPLCFGDYGSLEISNVEGGFGPHIYSLDGGDHFSTQTNYSAVEPGVYEVVVQDINGCNYEEVIEIIEPIDLNINLDADISIRLGDVYQLEAEVNIPASEIQSINWSPSTGLSCTDCLNPEANPFETINYELKVVNNNGCEDVAKLYLSVDRRDPIYIPNAFSPYNGDNTNDRFLIYTKEDAVKKVNSLLIFNRWGEMVFQVYDFPPNDSQYGWDGLHRGEKMNPGVFVYWTEVELIDGTKVLLKGDVTLMD